MNIFILEYIVLVATLLVAGYHVLKRSKTNEGLGKSLMNNGNRKQLFS